MDKVKSTFYAPLQAIHAALLERAGVELQVLRLDQCYPQLSGNKYFKLKDNIVEAKKRGCKQLLSFGGAYSNHIHALALAGQQNNMATIGLIRGEKTLPLNDTLTDAVRAGMKLIYLTREEYRQRNDPAMLAQLQRQYPGAFIIPEGGSNLLGVQGCMDIIEHIRQQVGDAYDCILLPCGTGATLAGVAASIPSKEVYGVVVLKGAAYLDAEVEQFVDALVRSGSCEPVEKNWTLLHDFHCGGYAKLSTGLVDFINDFHRCNAIPLEPVYSAKMFYALYNMLDDKRFRGRRVVAIHTGGLQGLRGMQQRYPQLLSA